MEQITQVQTFKDVKVEYYKSILIFVNQMVNNNEDAEDVTLSVFEKANRLYHTYDAKKSKVTTWLHMIAKSVSIDFLRKNTIMKDKYISLSDISSMEYKENYSFSVLDAKQADSDIINLELSNDIQRSFDALKPNYRNIAILFFVRECSYQEIAAELNVPIGTVKGMINRCRVQLQKKLQKNYKELAMS